MAQQQNNNGASTPGSPGSSNNLGRRGTVVPASAASAATGAVARSVDPVWARGAGVAPAGIRQFVAVRQRVERSPSNSTVSAGDNDDIEVDRTGTSETLLADELPRTASSTTLNSVSTLGSGAAVDDTAEEQPAASQALPAYDAGGPGEQAPDPAAAAATRAARPRDARVHPEPGLELEQVMTNHTHPGSAPPLTTTDAKAAPPNRARSRHVGRGGHVSSVHARAGHAGLGSGGLVRATPAEQQVEVLNVLTPTPRAAGRDAAQPRRTAWFYALLALAVLLVVGAVLAWYFVFK